MWLKLFRKLGLIDQTTLTSFIHAKFIFCKQRIDTLHNCGTQQQNLTSKEF